MLNFVIFPHVIFDKKRAPDTIIIVFFLLQMEGERLQISMERIGGLFIFILFD